MKSLIGIIVALIVCVIVGKLLGLSVAYALFLGYFGILGGQLVAWFFSGNK